MTPTKPMSQMPEARTSTARGFDSRPPASEANEGHYEVAGEPEPSASVPATDSHDEEQ